MMIYRCQSPFWDCKASADYMTAHQLRFQDCLDPTRCNTLEFPSVNKRSLTCCSTSQDFLVKPIKINQKHIHQMSFEILQSINSQEKIISILIKFPEVKIHPEQDKSDQSPLH